MAEPVRLTLSWDLGPDADFSVIAERVNELNSIILLAVDAQNLAYREQAGILDRETVEELQGGSFEVVAEALSIRAVIPPPSFRAARERRLQAILLEQGVPRAQAVSVVYENPLKIDLSVNFPFLVRILEIIRDWTTTRASNRAAAAYQKSELESRALARRAIRDEFMRRLPEVPTEDLARLLSEDTVDEVLAFSQHQPERDTGGDV
ncbi:hypothetical protein [Leifsonia shinshuensis]|uniref:Uncharacterized protein n=1 Tax=Leifsonia shinshuensis TaxID=150026 RepID=A0A853CYR8_9MICO|nr:hypothetical protein [Leifsonia shinshuensis]NYJ24461.1 hypothetical protein [Leifsonia shinshuensis]